MCFYSDTHLLKIERFGDVIHRSGFKPCQRIFWHSHSHNKNKGHVTHLRIFFQAFCALKNHPVPVMTHRKMRTGFNFQMRPRALSPSKATKILYPVLIKTRCEIENIWPNDIDNHWSLIPAETMLQNLTCNFLCEVVFIYLMYLVKDYSWMYI